MIDKGFPQKKVLGLVLCLAMMLSVMVVGAGAAFTDEKDFSANYQEAAEVLTNLEVLQGYPDGSFQPQGDITRAETATIIYRVVTGDVTDKYVGNYTANSQNQFSDVKNSDWFAGYVNYCTDAGYIKGHDGKFLPNDKVTGYEALAMILRAVGYDKDGSFTGEKWAINTAAAAEKLGILVNVKDEALGSAAPRELVAELIFQSMNVPTVTWSDSLGYNQYDSIVVNGGAGAKLNATLGEKTFGLEQTTGEISAVGRTAGTTTLRDRSTAANGTELAPVVVTGTSTPWTDIGYAAYVWTVPTTGAKTRAAVSDVTVTGESLKITTDGTKNNADVTVEKNARVYLNGEYVGRLNATGTTKTAVDNALNLSRIRGVKVDYIDNDNGGRAEVIVVTQYTVAKVTAITTADTTTGTQGVKETTTYLTDGKTTIPVKASALVTDDSLAVGDIVTYVEYAGDYYVEKAAATTAEFTNRNVAANKETTYTIGGETYYISGLEYVTNTSAPNTGVATKYLVNTNRKTDVDIYTDAYGYIIFVQRHVNPTSYLYVLSNEHTKANTGLTEAVVAFTDGTISTVQIANEDVAHDVLADAMYSYTTSGDTYTLGRVQTELTDGTYTNGTATITGKVNNAAASRAVDNATVVVDLRNYAVGDTSADVFTGYSEIPTVQNATLWFADRNNTLHTGSTITYAFLLKNTNDVVKNFMVYQTTNYSDEVDARTQNIVAYYMDVIIDGAVVEDYELTPAEFATIQDYGVGLYSFKNGDLTNYAAFNEVDGKTSTWANGRISVNYDNGAFGGTNGTVNYTYGADTKISVVNIGSGLTAFTPITGCTYDVYVVADGTAAEYIYVIVDTDDISSASTSAVTKTLVKGDYEYTYAVEKNANADDLTVCTGRKDIVNVHETAIPAAAIGENTGTPAGNTVTINLSYQDYLKVAEDGKVTITIDPADGNKIAVATASEYSSEAVDYTMTINAGETKQINIKSLGNKDDATVKTYYVKVEVAEPSDETSIEIDNRFVADTDYSVSDTTYNVLNSSLTGSDIVGLEAFVENYVTTTNENAKTEITFKSNTEVTLTVTAENGTNTTEYTFKVVETLS